MTKSIAPGLTMQVPRHHVSTKIQFITITGAILATGFGSYGAAAQAYNATRVATAPIPGVLTAKRHKRHTYYGVGKERSTATGGPVGGNPNRN